MGLNCNPDTNIPALLVNNLIIFVAVKAVAILNYSKNGTLPNDNIVCYITFRTYWHFLFNLSLRLHPREVYEMVIILAFQIRCKINFSLARYLLQHSARFSSDHEYSSFYLDSWYHWIFSSTLKAFNLTYYIATQCSFAAREYHSG